MPRKKKEILASRRKLYFYFTLHLSIVLYFAVSDLQEAHFLKSQGEQGYAFSSGTQRHKTRRSGYSTSQTYICGNYERKFSTGYLSELEEVSPGSLFHVYISPTEPSHFMLGKKDMSIWQISHINTFNWWGNTLFFSILLFFILFLPLLFLTEKNNKFGRYLNSGSKIKLKAPWAPLLFTSTIMFTFALPFFDNITEPAIPEKEAIIEPVESFDYYKIFSLDSNTIAVGSASSLHKIPASDYSAQYHKYSNFSSKKEFANNTMLCLASKQGNQVSFNAFYGNYDQPQVHSNLINSDSLPEFKINQYEPLVYFTHSNKHCFIKNGIFSTYSKDSVMAIQASPLEYGFNKSDEKLALFISDEMRGKTLKLSPAKEYAGYAFWDAMPDMTMVDMQIILELDKTQEKNSRKVTGKLIMSDKYEDELEEDLLQY